MTGVSSPSLVALFSGASTVSQRDLSEQAKNRLQTLRLGRLAHIQSFVTTGMSRHLHHQWSPDNYSHLQLFQSKKCLFTSIPYTCMQLNNTVLVDTQSSGISLPLWAVGADVGPSSQPAAVGSNLRLHVPLSLQQPLIRHAAPPLPQSRDPRDPRQHGGVQSQPWRYRLW